MITFKNKLVRLIKLEKNEDIREVEKLVLPEKLKALPEMIMGQENKLVSLSNKINSLKLEMSNKEAMLLMEIRKEITMTKNPGEKIVEKPKYKNDAERNFEQNNRLNTNAEYGTWKAEIQEKIHEKALTEIEVSYLKRTFSAAVALTNLGK